MSLYELICHAIVGAREDREIDDIIEFELNWVDVLFMDLDNLDIKVRPYVNETRNDNDNDLTREE